MSRIDLARAYLHTLEAGATGEEVRLYFTDDAVQTELPNRLLPQGASRDLGAIMAGADQGRHLLSAQTYEVLRAYEHQDTVILEVDWTGTLAVPLGPLSQGEVMKAHFAVFLDFVGDRIHRQRNYDCFEAW
ncbi:MAG: nuclear transport factor 2 family protein [Candidatus Eremiobacteraeota bacterium]|nr:nuclear transport factor 2 family protein [Candidatus Eremiobacteraeota bacterium]